MFSKKEIEVIKLRKSDLTQVEVAKKLNISQAAVSSFEKRIKEKLIDAKRTIEIAKQLKLV